MSDLKAILLGFLRFILLAVWLVPGFFLAVFASMGGKGDMEDTVLKYLTWMFPEDKK